MDFFLCTLAMMILIGILFYGIVKIVQQWTGCSKAEAICKIHHFVNGTVAVTFENDIDFQNEISENMRIIIGEKRFRELVNLSSTRMGFRWLEFGSAGKLPYIAISTYLLNETEKFSIENIMRTTIEFYLRVYGYDNRIILRWNRRNSLNMPVLVVNYARTDEESQTLTLQLQRQQKQIIKRHLPVRDEEEEEELY